MEIFKLVFSPIEVNTYILADKSGACAIIDCGCYSDKEFSKLTSLVGKKKLIPQLLLNTHCHLDHIFGNRMMLRKYGLKTLYHSGDEENRLNSAGHAMLFGLEMGMPPEPQGFIEDGQLITFGSVTLKALYVPGHSPGSLAFYSEKDGVVFTGDALFAGSIGRTDLPGGDYDTLMDSIRNKLFVLPPATVVYPGHGANTSVGQEMKTNPFFT
jgi:glyoxylase-like metal-dependent hydrolase (beta-lactamase superfamily II)